MVREAALIKVVLVDWDTLINAVDMLIAGVVHEAGGTTVTRNGDFEHVAGLATEAYE